MTNCIQILNFQIISEKNIFDMVLLPPRLESVPTDGRSVPMVFIFPTSTPLRYEGDRDRTPAMVDTGSNLGGSNTFFENISFNNCRNSTELKGV